MSRRRSWRQAVLAKAASKTMICAWRTTIGIIAHPYVRQPRELAWKCCLAEIASEHYTGCNEPDMPFHR